MPLDWQSLFFSPPPKQKKGITVFTDEELDALAQKEQAKLPEWKRKVAGLGEAAYDYTAGLLGLPGQPQTRANQYGELTEAGIPFLALGRKLKLPEINKKPVVFRGDPGVNPTGKVYSEINPQYFNRQDTLGYMAHAAEDKDYANSYMYKAGSPYSPNQTEHYYPNADARPNLTAVTSTTSKNAVDLTKLPDAEDTEKLIKGLEWWRPERSPFGSADRLNTRQKAKDLAEEIPHLYRKQMEIDKKLREGTPLSHREMRDLEQIGDAMDDIRIPLNDPEITDKLGFDAIRYTDINKASWAFPDVSKMETPWGTKLGQKSMGDYRYRVRAPGESTSYGSTRGGEDVGFFKTREEAIKNAQKLGRGSRIYVGSSTHEQPLTITQGEKNIDVKRNRIPGLADYLGKDKVFQDKLKKVPELKGYATQPKSLSEMQKLQDKFAQKVYNDDYDKLSMWAKEDVDALAKSHALGNKDYTLDNDFDDLDDLGWSEADKAAEKKAKLMMQLENEISSDEFGKDFNQLNDKEKLAVFDKAEQMYQDGDYEPSWKSSEGEDISNEVKWSKAPGGYAEAKEYSVKMPETKEELLDDLSYKEYAQPYDDIGPEWQEKINNLYNETLNDKLNKGITKQQVPGKLKAAADKLKSLTTASNPFDASPATIKKFQTEGISYDKAADHLFDDKYAYLEESQQKKVKDFVNWIEEGAEPSSEKYLGGLSQSATKSLGAAEADYQHFKKKGGNLHDFSEHFYGKGFTSLNKEQQKHIDEFYDIIHPPVSGSKSQLEMGALHSSDLQDDINKGIYDDDEELKKFVEDKIKQVKKFEMGDADALSGQQLFQKYPAIPYDYKIVNGKLVKMTTEEKEAYMAMKKAKHAEWFDK
jgi:hypothetical protein